MVDSLYLTIVLLPLTQVRIQGGRKVMGITNIGPKVMGKIKFTKQMGYGLAMTIA